jgi:hypothetical protein
LAVLLDEDFTKLESGRALPRGWTSDAMVVVKDNKDTPCLEVNKLSGDHFVKLPRTTLRGDFYIEGDFLANYSNPVYQLLTIHLESTKGGKRISVVFTPYYNTFAIGTNRPRAVTNFEAYKVNRFRISREGKVIRVSMNGKEADVAEFEVEEFDTVQIGLTAGGNPPARLYSLKLGVPER